MIKGIKKYLSYYRIRDGKAVHPTIHELEGVNEVDAILKGTDPDEHPDYEAFRMITHDTNGIPGASWVGSYFTLYKTEKECYRWSAQHQHYEMRKITKEIASLRRQMLEKQAELAKVKAKFDALVKKEEAC